MSDNKTEKSIKTVQKHSCSEPRMSEIRQKSSSEENILISYRERCQSVEHNPNQHFNTSHELKPNSQKFDTSSDEYADMSVEEIDRSYRELLLQDLEPTSFNVPCGRSSQINSSASATMSSKNTFSSESFSYSQKSKRRKISPNSDVTHSYFVDDHSFDSSSTKRNSSHSLVPFVNSKIQETYDLVMYDDTKKRKNSQNSNVTCRYSLDDHSFGSSVTKQKSSDPLVPFVNSKIQDMKLFKSMHKDCKNSTVPKSTMSQLGLAEYKCTSQRKIASNLMNLPKTVNMCSQNSEVTHQFSLDDHSFNSLSTKQRSSHPLMPFVNSKIQEMYNDTDMKLFKSKHKDGENSTVPKSTMSQLDLAEYKCTSERKIASNLMNLPKTINMCSQNSEVTHQYSLNDHSFNYSSTKQNSSHPLVPFVNTKIQETYDLEMYDDTNIKLFKSQHKDFENSAAPKSTMSKLDLAEYKYTSKRKMASNLTNLQKTVNKCSQLSALCNNPSRVQKGVSSQTVCKRVSFKNGQVTQSMESSSSQYFQTSDSPLNCSYQTQSFPTNGKIRKLEGRSNSKSSEKFGASCFSQGNVILTPRETPRLSYEKIPGKKGQTRLIFQ